MNRDEWLDWCKTLPNVKMDYPFDDPDIVAFRHVENKKWFALFMYIKGIPCVNVKVNPFNNDGLCEMYEGITPGYHMNKRHWIMIDLQSDVPEVEIKSLFKDSFDLTIKRKKNRQAK